MSLCPFAVHKLLPENKTQARIDPTQFILHTAVDAPGPTSLYGYFARADVVQETHFYIRLNGVIEQYMDTNVRADGNRDANVRAISVETEDEGNPVGVPWTDAQIVSIKRLGDWVMATHPKVLRRLCPSWDTAGWGWHAMWGAPSHWTPSRGKTCPGSTRINQIQTTIVPWLDRGDKDEFDMATLADLEKIVNTAVDAAVAVLKAKDVEMRDSLAALARKIDAENDAV